MNGGVSVIFKYIKSYYSSGFNLLYFLSVVVLLSILLYFNYYHTPVKELLAGSIHTRAGHFITDYIFYFIPFATAFLLQLFFYRDRSYFKSKLLCAFILIAPAIFSIRSGIDFYQPALKIIFKGDQLLLWKFCAGWIIRAAFTIGILCCILPRKTIRTSLALTSTRPYLILLLCMLPFIIVAAFQPSFLALYPRTQAIQHLQLSNKYLGYLLFELSYAFDLLSIEFFFRAFLIIAFIRFCGMHCIVPAACFYCCVHLGKPMGEAISSFWGGMLLGIISYHTKSIRAAVLLHIGLAWLMDATGFFAHLI